MIFTPKPTRPMKKVKARGSRHVIAKIRNEAERLREQERRRAEQRAKDEARRAEQDTHGTTPAPVTVTKGSVSPQLLMRIAATVATGHL